MEFVIIILVGIACAFFAAKIGERKGNRRDGFILGLLFGPLGVLFAFLLDDKRASTCPRCKKQNIQTNMFCCHCGTDMHRKVIMCPHCSKVIKL